MDSQQAKVILSLYRPGTADGADPELTEALAQTKRDAELGRWFEQHCGFQTDVREQFRSIPVPDGLKQSILAEVEMRRKIVWWSSPAVLAAAAALVLFAGLAAWWLRPKSEDTFAAYRERMVRTALRDYRMNMLTEDHQQIREYLGSHLGHREYVLTQGLGKLPGYGCAVIRWHGHRVSLVCFKLVDAGELYLFIIDRSAIANPPLSTNPEFARVNKLTTASWTVGDKTYLLAAQANPQLLRSLL